MKILVITNYSVIYVENYRSRNGYKYPRKELVVTSLLHNETQTKTTVELHLNFPDSCNYAGSVSEDF